MKTNKTQPSHTHDMNGVELKEGDIMEMYPNLVKAEYIERVKVVRLENGELGYTYFERKTPSTFSLKYNTSHNSKII